MDKIGASIDVRKASVEAIFGKSGITACTDDVAFEYAVSMFHEGILATASEQFQSYFTNRLLPLLRSNMKAGCGTSTNNNTASNNHVLKQTVQWKPHQLPDLINKIRDLVEGLFDEADRAIIALSDLQLQPTHAKHKLTISVWKAMTAVQRKRAIEACFRMPSCPSSMSTDGTFRVPITPGGGKKLHQRKRPRTERTETVGKKKLKVK